MAVLKSIGSAMKSEMINESLREIKQKNDQIRGLKAIIYSLSWNAILNKRNLNNGHKNNKLTIERHTQEILG